MIYLVAQPEVAYIKDENEVIDRWYPPSKHFFKFLVKEYPNGVSIDEARSELLISEQLVYLTEEEIAHYKKKYGH